MPVFVLILSPIFILLLGSLAMIGLRIWRPRLALYWLTATGAALLTLIGVLLLSPHLPATLQISFWQPVEIFPLSPIFSINNAAWLFAVAISTILLASNLTSIANSRPGDEQSPNWSSLTGGLGITCLSLLVMFAGNILTILLAWVMIDLVEFIIYISLTNQAKISERVVIKFAVRSSGSVIGIFALMNAIAQDLPLTLTDLNASTSSLLILAVGFRLGLIPNTPILPISLPAQPGYGALLRLVTSAANLPLLFYTAQSGAPLEIQNILLVWCGITAILSALSWISAHDTQAGRHYWVIGLSSLILASAISRTPLAVIALGWILLLPGSFIMLSTHRNRWLMLLFGLAALAISSLPYTPGWHGVNLFSGGFHLSWLFLLPAQGLFLAGFLRYSFLKPTQTKTEEGWSNLVYFLGLSLIILMTYLMTWWMIQDPSILSRQNPTLTDTWPALVNLLLVLSLWIFRKKITDKESSILTRLSTSISFGKIFKPIWALYFLVRRVFLFVSQTLESPPGVLWTLLIMVLLISLFFQSS